MAIRNKLATLIEILPWLSQNPGASVSQTAEHFKISESDLLSLLQLAVLTGPGQAGGELIDIDFEDTESLFVLDAKGLDRPVNFSIETTMALVGGLQYLMQIPGMLDQVAMQSLLAKLQKTLELSEQVIEVVSDEIVTSHLAQLTKSIKEQKCLEITYVSPNNGRISKRIIEPKSVLVSSGYNYVSAWCNAAIDFRLFRVDRIQEIAALDRSQAKQEDATDPDFIGSFEVRLICDLLSALDFDKRMIKSSAELSETEVELVIGVHDLHWLAGEILASGGRLRPVNAPELTEIIRDKIKNWQELNPE